MTKTFVCWISFAVAIVVLVALFFSNFHHAVTVQERFLAEAHETDLKTWAILEEKCAKNPSRFSTTTKIVSLTRENSIAGSFSGKGSGFGFLIGIGFGAGSTNSSGEIHQTKEYVFYEMLEDGSYTLSSVSAEGLKIKEVPYLENEAYIVMQRKPYLVQEQYSCGWDKGFEYMVVPIGTIFKEISL